MIQKLQTGGAPTLAYSAYPPQTATAVEKPTSQDKDSLISEDLIKKLQEKGIPVDVSNLLETIGNLEYQVKMGMPVSSRSVRKIEAQINRVIQQADYLEKAEEKAVKNDAFGEIAVGDRGQLFTFNKNGKIQQVSLGEYDIEKHGPALTVNELIEQRKFNPTQAYDT